MTKYLSSFLIGHISSLSPTDSGKAQHLHKVIELGRLRAYRQAAALEAAAYRSPNKTTQHLANFALAQALRNLVYTASAKEEDSWEPTTHAARYFQYFGLESLLDLNQLSIPNQYSIAGHLGSVAFLAVTNKLTEEIDLSDLITLLLDLFWDELGLNVNDAPATRYKALQTQVGLDKTYIESLAQSTLALYPNHAPFRQKFIGHENFKNLTQRIWMGEFSDFALAELEAIQTKANTDPVFQDKYDFPYQPAGTLTRIVSKLLFVGNSAGVPAVHRALIAEAYFNIYLLLKNIDAPMTEFASNLETETTRYLLAHWYALISDAHSCNALFNTHLTSAGAATQARDNCYQWLATTNTAEIDIEDDYRLGGFV